MLQTNPSEKKDPGFQFSLNLMVIGGTLLLCWIISLNKLVIHYFSSKLDLNSRQLYKINVMERETFQIFSERELYFTWLSFSLSLIGLITVIYKLVKTWRQ
jgi:hypothetical protein